jgi:hypothetical protein
MTTEKVKATKGVSVDDDKDLHAMVTELLGEEDIKAFFEKAALKADALVARNKKDMTREERNKFEHACLRKASWELLREYSLDAANPRIFSMRFLAIASAQAVVNTAVTAITIGVLGALTRTRGVTVEAITATEGTDTNSNDSWAGMASTRPGRRNSTKVEAVI